MSQALTVTLAGQMQPAAIVASLVGLPVWPLQQPLQAQLLLLLHLSHHAQPLVRVLLLTHACKMSV